MTKMNFNRRPQTRPARLGQGKIYRIKFGGQPKGSKAPLSGRGGASHLKRPDQGQLRRLRAMGVRNVKGLTWVQADFALRALEPISCRGVSVHSIMVTDGIKAEAARRRSLLDLRATIREGARQANLILSEAYSGDWGVLRVRATVTAAVVQLQSMVDQRLAKNDKH